MEALPIFTTKETRQGRGIGIKSARAREGIDILPRRAVSWFLKQTEITVRVV
jgi:hypothetical protein